MRLLTCFLLAGCVSDFSKVDQGPPDFAEPVDMAHPVDLTPPVDLEPPPDLTPPIPRWNPDIQTDFDNLGCGSVNCHAVSTGLYSPLIQAMPGAAAMAQNYSNVIADGANLTSPSASLILTKNLAGDGVSHAGSATFKPFISANDAMYKKWLYWLSNGAPQ